MINPSKNYDVEKHYTNPRAWGNFKKAIGNQHGISDLMRMLEKRADGYCVRLLMAQAIHAYLAANEQRKSEIQSSFFKWRDSHGDNEPAPNVEQKADPPEDVRASYLEIVANRLSTDTLQILCWVIELGDTKDRVSETKMYEQMSDVTAAIAEAQQAAMKQIKNILTGGDSYEADESYQAEIAQRGGAE